MTEKRRARFSKLMRLWALVRDGMPSSMSRMSRNTTSGITQTPRVSATLIIFARGETGDAHDGRTEIGKEREVAFIYRLLEALLVGQSLAFARGYELDQIREDLKDGVL
jgi:hypothetical protein